MYGNALLLPASPPRGQVLAKLAFIDHAVIGLIGASDLILRFPIACCDQGDNLVAALPDLIGWVILSVTDVLSDGITVRAHDASLQSVP